MFLQVLLRPLLLSALLIVLCPFLWPFVLFFKGCRLTFVFLAGFSVACEHKGFICLKKVVSQLLFTSFFPFSPKCQYLLSLRRGCPTSAAGSGSLISRFTSVATRWAFHTQMPSLRAFSSAL